MTNPKNEPKPSLLEKHFDELLDAEYAAIRNCKRILDSQAPNVNSAMRILNWLHDYYEVIAETMEQEQIRKAIDPDSDAKWKDSLKEPEA